MPSLLHDSMLETITVAETSPANGKLIRELELRTKTGASIVGIERSGQSVVNPGPDEEIRGGDEILLLGTEEHLKSAVEFFGQLAEEPPDTAPHQHAIEEEHPAHHAKPHRKTHRATTHRRAPRKHSHSAKK
jgi:uncharacterized protein with PhoU and TrkA domain